VHKCQRLSINIKQFYCRFPAILPSQYQRVTIDLVRIHGTILILYLGLLLGSRLSIGPFYAQPYTSKHNSITLGLYSIPAPADLSISICFNCGKIGYFASSCLKPYSIPRINKIKQEDKEVLGNNKITNENKSDSEN
jgi:hypothetical protein